VEGGSSPRARGAPDQGRGRLVGRGIIPACAGSTSSSTTTGPTRGDHPRVRGEHIETLLLVDRQVGSSPRARGAPPRRARTPCARGIIPACAGSTIPAVQQVGSPGGSSPRARGARGRSTLTSGEHGIIPACAGSTSVSLPAPLGAGDHPRVRGEHAAAAGTGASGAGSSPRARGAPAPAASPARRPGIIPACAGSTRTGAVRPPERGDHPRVRGEHMVSTRASEKK